MKILLTGGSGRLGTELQKLRKYDFAPRSHMMDITLLDDVVGLESEELDLIVHAAAYTKVEQAEIDSAECLCTNVLGTGNLMNLEVPILYISTEYAFSGTAGMYKEWDLPSPINKYARSKVGGENLVLGGKGKVLRCIFKPRPWPYPKAYFDQFTSGDYVDVIAKEIDLAITLFDRLPKIIHIGTGRKSIYDLARQTRDVVPMSRMEVGVNLPRDCSLNHELWDSIKKEYYEANQSS